jgi:hypothetical protein
MVNGTKKDIKKKNFKLFARKFELNLNKRNFLLEGICIGIEEYFKITPKGP